MLYCRRPAPLATIVVHKPPIQSGHFNPDHIEFLRSLLSYTALGAAHRSFEMNQHVVPSLSSLASAAPHVYLPSAIPRVVPRSSQSSLMQATASTSASSEHSLAMEQGANRRPGPQAWSREQSNSPHFVYSHMRPYRSNDHPDGVIEARPHVKLLLVVAVALLDERNGKVLLAQRPPGKSHAGLWELPGGKVSLHGHALCCSHAPRGLSEARVPISVRPFGTLTHALFLLHSLSGVRRRSRLSSVRPTRSWAWTSTRRASAR